MTRSTSLGLHRAVYISLLLSMGAMLFGLLMDEPKASELSAFAPFIVITLGMFSTGLGLGLGAHFVILDHVPPTLPRVLGAAMMGGAAGAGLCFLGFFVVGLLADSLGLLDAGWIEGLGAATLFLPFWIFFLGSFAIGARYLAARVHGFQLIVAPTMGALGALVGDWLMALTLFRPTPPAPGLRAPFGMTAALGALIAFGLAWAERGMSDGTPAPLDSHAATDVERE